jgi:hypothetical protein
MLARASKAKVAVDKAKASYEAALKKAKEAALVAAVLPIRRGRTAEVAGTRATSTQEIAETVALEEDEETEEIVTTTTVTTTSRRKRQKVN